MWSNVILDMNTKCYKLVKSAVLNLNNLIHAQSGNAVTGVTFCCVKETSMAISLQKLLSHRRKGSLQKIHNEDEMYMR